MMATPLRAIANRLHNYILALVGFSEPLDRMNGLLGRIGALEGRLNQVAARLDAITARDGALVTTVAAEVDRLDGYLSHHLATLDANIAAAHSNLLRLRDPVLTAQGLDAMVIADCFDLIVPTQETGLLAYIMRHGLEFIEPGVRTVLRDRLRPGSVAVDAGANIGIHALTMARAVGPEGQVLCFEPLPHLAATLERTLCLNGFGGRTRVKQLALADAPGDVTLYRSEHGPMSSLYPLPDGLAAEPITVRAVTLDESFAPGARVDLVKMDVEGAEPRLWHGMQRIVEENADIEIVLEWSASHFRRTGEDPEAFMTKIRAAGFSPYVIEDRPETAGQLTPLSENVAVLEASNLLLTRRAVVQAAREIA
jgi:FkbM family methyltransferase